MTKNDLNEREALIIPGINPVIEALERHSESIREIWIRENRSYTRLGPIIELSHKEGVLLLEKKSKDLEVFSHLNHQGVIAFLKYFPYKDMDQFLREIDIQSNPYLIATDHITDEGNLGSIIRSACFFGASSIILTKDRSAKISPNVLKRSSGACMAIDVIIVSNMHMALRKLKEKGFWIIGTNSRSGTFLYDFDLRRPCVLIMGSESKGLSPVLNKVIDAELNIPGEGRFNSLNVGVAAGILLYEMLRQRLKGERTLRPPQE